MHSSPDDMYQAIMARYYADGAEVSLRRISEQMAELRASTELAVARWKRSEAIRKAAIDQICDQGLLIEELETHISTLRAALIEIRQVANAPGDDIRAIVDSVLSDRQ